MNAFSPISVRRRIYETMETNTFIIAVAVMFLVYIIIRLLVRR
jgi:hypothetical protein